MTPQTIAAIVIAAVSFGAGCLSGSAWMGREVTKVEKDFAVAQAQWSQAKVKADEAYLATLTAARNQEQAWQTAAHQAEAKNAELKKQADTAARSADDAGRRLRDESIALTVALNRVSAGSAAPGVRVANALSDVVRECGSRLAEMARKADEREIERRTLIGAWPK